MKRNKPLLFFVLLLTVMCNFYDLITSRLQTCFFELPSGAWADFRLDLVWVPQTTLRWTGCLKVTLSPFRTSTYVWSQCLSLGSHSETAWRQQKFVMASFSLLSFGMWISSSFSHSRLIQIHCFSWDPLWLSFALSDLEFISLGSLGSFLLAGFFLFL